ncbi:MAG: hypothetical protein NTV34_13395, partial [Proteobacteria bacterium]|nr:hypothetical protein [Pseudomonadota bacterium]
MINHISLISILLTATFSSTLYSTERGTRRSSGFTSTAEIEFDSTFDLADYTGQTYLSFMTTEVKPAMDTLATDGYVVKGAEAMATAFESVGPKVQGKVARDFGGIENVKKIASKLEGTTVTLATLPGKIKEVDRSASIYDLATFIGLASGGGVKVKYADQNYGLNIHYDVTEQRSGRSYGVGPTRNANDASDKEYLTDLESYVRGSKDNLGEFYTTLFESLLNSDPSNYALVSPEGQTLLTDFLAVFTAEQARNLMDGRIAPHWDAALLEVTLLASFHAGQDKIELFYTNPATRETAFTDKTLKQTPCKAAGESLQAARLSDYWQFSRNITDPSNCRRSGI